MEALYHSGCTKQTGRDSHKPWINTWTAWVRENQESKISNTRTQEKLLCLSPWPGPLGLGCKCHILCWLLTPIISSSAQDSVGLSWCPESNKLVDGCASETAAVSETWVKRIIVWRSHGHLTPSTPAAPNLIHTAGNISYVEVHKFSVLPWKDVGLCSCYTDETEFGVCKETRRRFLSKGITFWGRVALL